jgi:tetratricopeptide (TPR) repeat protein
MARNLQLAAWLAVGTMAIAIGCEPQATSAWTIDPSYRQAAVDIRPVAATQQYQDGLTAVAAGNLNQAMSNFDQAIKLDPQYFQAYIERGNVKTEVGDLPGAVADYTTAITLNPKSVAAYYNRGTVLSKSGRHQLAIADYDTAIRIDPQYAQAYMNRGNELDDLGDSAGAISSYDRAIQMRPDYALAYLNRGIAHGRSGHRPQAMADLQLAAKLFKQMGQIDRYNRTLQIIKSF